MSSNCTSAGDTAGPHRRACTSAGLHQPVRVASSPGQAYSWSSTAHSPRRRTLPRKITPSNATRIRRMAAWRRPRQWTGWLRPGGCGPWCRVPPRAEGGRPVAISRRHQGDFHDFRPPLCVHEERQDEKLRVDHPRQLDGHVVGARGPRRPCVNGPVQSQEQYRPRFQSSPRGRCRNRARDAAGPNELGDAAEKVEHICRLGRRGNGVHIWRSGCATPRSVEGRVQIGRAHV